VFHRRIILNANTHISQGTHGALLIARENATLFLPPAKDSSFSFSLLVLKEVSVQFELASHKDSIDQLSLKGQKMYFITALDNHWVVA
jgi:hypothetical protein